MMELVQLCHFGISTFLLQLLNIWLNSKNIVFTYKTHFPVYQNINPAIYTNKKHRMREKCGKTHFLILHQINFECKVGVQVCINHP